MTISGLSGGLGGALMTSSNSTELAKRRQQNQNGISGAGESSKTRGHRTCLVFVCEKRQKQEEERGGKTRSGAPCDEKRRKAAKREEDVTRREEISGESTHPCPAPCRRAAWTRRCRSRCCGLSGGPRSPSGGVCSVHVRERPQIQLHSGHFGRTWGGAPGATGRPGCCCCSSLTEVSIAWSSLLCALVSQPAFWDIGSHLLLLIQGRLLEICIN